MSGGDDIAARVRAIHAARAEVDASLGLDSTPTTSGGVVPAAWLADARAARDDAADAYDWLVRRVWEAATGDTHEGPASVEVLLEAVAGLRARADGAEAARDTLRAAAGSYLVTVTGCAAAGELLNDAQAAYERAVDQVRAEPGSSSHRTEVAHTAVRLSAAGLACIDAGLTRDAARACLRALAGEG